MQDRIVRSLSEDFAKIGWDKGVNELNRLSSNRLDESLYSVPAITADPIDGPVVTVELLSRIADLDFNALSESDLDDLLDGLREKELPEGDADLAEAAEAVVKAILESRKIIYAIDKMGKRKKKAAPGFHMVDGRAVKVKKSDALRSARKKIRYDKRTAGKRNTYEKGKGARIELKRKVRGFDAKSARLNNRRPQNADDMSDGLVLELNSILGEGNQYGDYGDTVSRVARIMSLLEAILGSDVGNVLESAYETMEGSLLAENSDPQRAFGPALKVIARCLEQIDDLGNG